LLADYQQLRLSFDRVKQEKSAQADLAVELKERLDEMVTIRRQRNQLAEQTNELNERIQVHSVKQTGLSYILRRRRLGLDFCWE
jgi:hypothetical protein